MKKAELTGRVFGRLTVIKTTGKDKNRKILWLCNCTCGNSKVIIAQSLLRGASRSCGCGKHDTNLGTTTHGQSNTRVYRAWWNMKLRCLSPLYEHWLDYGGRGISFCSSWETFENFFADMGHPPENTSLDRKDNNGNYNPENCRWATILEQRNNTRATTRVSKSRELGISVKALKLRIRAGKI